MPRPSASLLPLLLSSCPAAALALSRGGHAPLLRITPLRAASPALMGQAEGPATAAVRRYFEAWNRRDMEAAVREFDESCVYEDTQYAGAFEGKARIRSHLNRVADALPPTFQFCIDEVADGGTKVGVQWHVENEGVALPFTRGCSMYTCDLETGRLISGFDVPEPAPFKPGGASLTLLSVASKLIAQPVRALPLALWAAYMYIVFFSNGILPGPDATQLDPATWAEVVCHVRDLSLNFWLVAPLLNLPFSPTVHPMLEGIFNGLLAWAALFGGFAIDGLRKSSDVADSGAELPPGENAMLPVLIGMQFLTSAVLLPYLVVRPAPQVSGTLSADKIDALSAAGESRVLPVLLGGVGAASVAWAVLGRPEAFGAELGTRFDSLVQLLSTDRVGSSFVVDLVIFALFQGWLVDDDLRRRGVAPTTAPALRALGSYVPFFGLVGYLLLRPRLPAAADADSR